MTNETINIWSHIFGWMLFLALTLYDLFLLNLEASVFDKFIVGLLLCCFQVSLNLPFFFKKKVSFRKKKEKNWGERLDFFLL